MTSLNIREARQIARAVSDMPADDLRYSKSDMQAAFQKLHRSAERGSKSDKTLAQAIWNVFGADQ